MGDNEMDGISVLIDTVLRAVEIISDTQYKISESVKNETRDKVKELCSKFPMR
jgi:glycine/serine hydroxymethyltransferase